MKKRNNYRLFGEQVDVTNDQLSLHEEQNLLDFVNFVYQEDSHKT